eukprot:CAMPEP_0183720618 /NCGR_PEP_ID=MMETSP0737-20130205/13181_1 /TAXON_ID=385413 /ORGANISM="Thalassiosira miniscula, Strain CCMP1093" /LENGTH=192 /DNA_ID=CAMNT_0025950507 /DNA_START=570 /DNA_END=1148 /DNA_ORIENTATION=-
MAVHVVFPALSQDRPTQDEAPAVVPVEVLQEDALVPIGDVFPHFQGQYPIRDGERERLRQVDPLDVAVGPPLDVPRPVVGGPRHVRALVLDGGLVLADAGAKIGERCDILAIYQRYKFISHHLGGYGVVFRHRNRFMIVRLDIARFDRRRFATHPRVPFLEAPPSRLLRGDIPPVSSCHEDLALLCRVLARL